MSTDLVVLDQKYHHFFENLPVRTMTPLDYILKESVEINTKNKVYNLASSYSYQDLGYYVSLLAIARNEKVFPTPTTIQDLKDRKIQKLFSEDIHDLIQTKLKKIKSNSFELSVYFGTNLSGNYRRLAWELYRIIQAPMFRVYFEREVNLWDVTKIKILSIKDLSPTHIDFLGQATRDFFSTKKAIKTTSKKNYYDLAILYNEDEEASPSNKKALENFVDAFKKVGFRTYMIQHKDRPNIAEYDALFIRETTSVTHHTYRMARNAEKEGLIVIDDPSSIVKCTNKIFLEQLMERLKISRPKTKILDKKSFQKNLGHFEYPCVIKKPDSAFSQGVHKASNEDQLVELATELFKDTDLVLIQEFLPTDFDWRIGVLNGKVLYACKYFMAKDHWQIINNKSADAEDEQGEFECLNPKDVDEKVIKIALKTANAIGRGLYGVDLKQKGKDVYLIEVNDNPSIDAGVEDKLLGKDLYLEIAKHFMNECHAKRGIYVQQAVPDVLSDRDRSRVHDSQQRHTQGESHNGQGAHLTKSRSAD